ncbi:MAG: hypothetical protein IJR88_04125 [Clostridia bacterium]|nr:hypothetical protein [Clostridia bacterium]
MRNNIGRIIKIIAAALFATEAFASFVIGIVLITGREMDGLGALLLFIGPVAAAALNLLLYGYGEIIEKLCAIERNTRGDEVKSEAKKPVADKKRINQIESLHAQGLITEEEYQQLVSKNNAKENEQ